MTRKIKTLPNEILLDILRLLPHKTVYQCLFVCKDCTFAAAQDYYKEVSLTGAKIISLNPFFWIAARDRK